MKKTGRILFLALCTFIGTAAWAQIPEAVSSGNRCRQLPRFCGDY
ncbi:MAG: hypothetical protein ACOXZJ_05470 [Bacteroidales bacterium]